MLDEDDISRAGLSVQSLTKSGRHSSSMGDTSMAGHTATSGGNEAVVTIHAVQEALLKQAVPKDSIIVTLGLIAINID